MFGDHFYNQRVRKSVAVFGSLFDNLYVVRTSGGSSYSQTKVPLSYSPKRKFLERIAEMNNGEDSERQLAIKLPRMSFEILGINYDPTRQLPKTNNYKRSVPTDESKRKQYYIGVPYVIAFQLNIYGKTQDDALQIVEQIIPYFNPQYTVSMKPYDGVDDIVEDVPIILTAVSFSDDYEGDMAQRRTIVYTLDFEMKIGFYGPAPSDGSNVITQVDVNLFNMDAGIADSDLFLTALSITPDPLVTGDSDYSLIITHLDTEQP
jgi:hypothetical protein